MSIDNKNNGKSASGIVGGSRATGADTAAQAVPWAGAVAPAPAWPPFYVPTRAPAPLACATTSAPPPVDCNSSASPITPICSQPALRSLLQRLATRLALSHQLHRRPGRKQRRRARRSSRGAAAQRAAGARLRNRAPPAPSTILELPAAYPHAAASAGACRQWHRSSRRGARPAGMFLARIRAASARRPLGAAVRWPASSGSRRAPADLFSSWPRLFMSITMSP